jgi:hypothetical protein
MTESGFSFSEASRAATSVLLAFFSFRRAQLIAEQSPDPASFPINADIRELPPILVQNKRYLKEDWLHKKRKRRSWVRDYGTYLVEINSDFESQGIWWACDLCDKKRTTYLYKADSTNAADGHFKGEHGLNDVDGDEQAGRSRLSVLQLQRKAAAGTLISRDRTASFKALFLQWIVDQNISLSAVESDFFRDLLTFLSKDVDVFLFIFGDIVHNWLMAVFDARKQDIKREFKEDTLSKIHLFFDLWTSLNQFVILGIVAHYLDRKTWKN